MAPITLLGNYSDGAVDRAEIREKAMTWFGRKWTSGAQAECSAATVLYNATSYGYRTGVCGVNAGAYNSSPEIQSHAEASASSEATSRRRPGGASIVFLHLG
jgi:hypothetical protein